MKLWKILLATMIALVLVCAVAMAEDAKPCANGCTPSEYKSVAAPTCEVGQKYEQYMCSVASCPNSKVVLNTAYGQPLGHAWTEKASKDVAPTCTEAGSKYYFCGRGCGAEKTAPIEKLGHKGVKSNQLSVAPTCTEAGFDWFKCSVCQETWTKDVKALGHDFSVTVAGVPANCHSNGHTSYLACSREGCKEINGKVVIPANDNHTNADEVTELYVAPSCIATGTKHFYCADCGARWTQTVAKIGHDPKNVEAKKPTCTEDGYTAHVVCKVKGCDYVYGKTVIPASGTAHTWQPYGGKKDATCAEGGWEKTEICKNCGTVNYVGKTEKLAHDFSIVIDHVDPSCTAKGYTEYRCANGCGKTDKTEIAMLDHTYVENGDKGWKTVLAPNCTSIGRAERSCTKCGKATQIKDIPALGHVMGSPEWVKAPDCVNDGEGISTCLNGCGKTEKQVIKALGHSKYDQVVAEADCTHDGMKHIWCGRTGCKTPLLEKNVIIKAKGHKGEVTKLVEATCTAEGSKTTKCTVCKQTVTEVLPKLAHKYEWVTTPATPSANGKSEYKCACGDVKETKTVKYTKWYYNNTITSFGPTTRELVGGNDWYRVTPVDLTVDGVYTYDLIASNKYIVGKVTITVNAGALTVSYKTNYDVDVKDEALLIYASKADLATGTAVTAPVGAAINAAETFGADTKVLVSLILTGDYDAAGKGLVDASAAAGMIANID